MATEWEGIRSRLAFSVPDKSPHSQRWETRVSVEAMAIALHHSRARGTDKVILMGIANHDQEGGSWPSRATLARYANVSERSVKHSLRHLEELNEIETHIQQGGTRDTPEQYRPNLYIFTLRCPKGCRGSNHTVED